MIEKRCVMENGMRIVAWEYVTANGGARSDNAAMMAAEGAMMAEALMRDLGDVAEIEAVLARDLAPALADCDAFWPIAPETDGALEQATRLARAADRIVLNSAAEAVAIASSKRATARRLAECGIPVVATHPPGDLPPSGKGWVVKPDKGTGGADARIVAQPQEIADHAAGLSDAVVQPYVPGTPLSLSIIAQDGAAWLLSCNLQRVEHVGDGFAYRGSIVGGAEHRRDMLLPIAEAVAAAMPGLWGHVGIDLIDGPSGPEVLEINPRITTSYVGLRASLGLNPAALILALLDAPLAGLRRKLQPRAVEVEVTTA
jgi:predicted ATP-grasp superfamily ATP-dependent carboligase